MSGSTIKKMGGKDMKEYRIRKIEKDKIGIEDAVWDNAEVLKIDCTPWKEYSRDIYVKAQLLYSDENLMVKFETNEKPLLARKTEDNGDVCCDSCVEIFFKNKENDTEYVNIETNPLGTKLIGKGSTDGLKLLDDTKEVQAFSLITPDVWNLELLIPWSYIEKHLGKISDTFYANLYKCGDETVIEHYLCWNEIDFPKPNFHLPQFFGKLILE